MSLPSNPVSFVPPPGALPACELCQKAGGLLVWGSADWRVIRVEDADFPAFYRVVSNRHVGEFSDLPIEARERCTRLVVTVERVLLERVAPTKVNLAALGNMVPHLHWHVVARFAWDSHFPQPIWGQRQREVVPAAVARLALTLDALDAAVAAALADA
ncbi:HIT family protein [Piscinibacter sp. HJYY11]|uniref:HIT family protein n=1 Tax=Piscinibacter sp. HJYY11 TaxID=2801333 RepID=UPI00191F1FF1|nr:HIT family protein [Piscinibacter sp. HJYY11]MBL0730283.1 HIT family protein [Piscinibacter sp. HJYY11]